MAMLLGLLLLLQVGTADALYREGVRLFESGKPADAAKHLEQATTLAPANAQYWKVLGVTYAAQKDYASALNPFQKACELAPSLIDACYFYGRALYALDRYEHAIKALDRAMQFAASKPRSQLGKAQALEALGRSIDAETEYRAANSEPDAPVLYGQFLFRAGRLDEALTILKTAKPSEDSHYQLGRVLYQLGRLDEAIANLEAAPNKPEAKLLLEKAYRRLGSTTSK